MAGVVRNVSGGIYARRVRSGGRRDNRLNRWLIHRGSHGGLGSGDWRMDIWISVSRRGFEHLSGAVELTVHIVLRFAKFANSLAEALRKFGQLLCTEHDENNHEYNQHIRTREVWQERKEVGREGIHKQVLKVSTTKTFLQRTIPQNPIA